MFHHTLVASMLIRLNALGNVVALVHVPFALPSQAVASALEAEKEYTGTVTSKCGLLEEINQHLEEQTSGLQEEVQSASAEKQQLQSLYDQLSQACTALQRNADVLNVKNKELETLLVTNQNKLLEQAKELSDRNARAAAEKRVLEDRLAAEQRERAAERQKLMGTVGSVADHHS
jgi:chromosome segregation ATPase